MGAIATCPLEVVKTRLQSSSFSVMMGQLPPAASGRSSATTCRTMPPRRRLCTSAMPSSASQVVHLSGHNLPPNPPTPGHPRTLSLINCLRWVDRPSKRGLQSLTDRSFITFWSVYFVVILFRDYSVRKGSRVVYWLCLLLLYMF